MVTKIATKSERVLKLKEPFKEMYEEIRWERKRHERDMLQLICVTIDVLAMHLEDEEKRERTG